MEKLQFLCQHCGQKLRANARRLGETVNCPKCSNLTTLLQDTRTNPKSETSSEAKDAAKHEGREGANAAAVSSNPLTSLPNHGGDEVAGTSPENGTSPDNSTSPDNGISKGKGKRKRKRRQESTEPRQPTVPPQPPASPPASLAAPRPLGELVHEAEPIVQDSARSDARPVSVVPPNVPSHDANESAPRTDDASSQADVVPPTGDADLTHGVASDSPPLPDEVDKVAANSQQTQEASFEPQVAAVSSDGGSSVEFDFTNLGAYDYEPEETEWVVETDAGDEGSPNFDPHKVSIPRRILYYQGALLAGTALFAFILGMVFGRSFAPRTAAVAVAIPCAVSGKVEFSRGGLASMPDEGSVVIAVPRDYKPDLRERRELEKIGSATDDRDPSVDTLRSMGGDFAVTDRRGQFKLNLPDHGRYYLLVLSANSQRPVQEEFNRLHLSEMGTYFGPAQRLVGDRRFHWRTESFTGDQEINILF